MLEENEKITLTGEEAITILSEVEYILISLRNIARYYYHKENGEVTDSEKNQYYQETTNFIDKNNVTHRLALIRRVVSEKFNDELGDDDMDDIERELEKLQCWEKPGD
ncbi:hypothetical protein [Pantoea vagans]|uniref:hypothetical protein n=1 Tax=Pantoea vagans TaxID=470934 RepID=UPI0028E4A209|nr:hypothetical protein [Pantoea vagans]